MKKTKMGDKGPMTDGDMEKMSKKGAAAKMSKKMAGKGKAAAKPAAKKKAKKKK